MKIRNNSGNNVFRAYSLQCAISHMNWWGLIFIAALSLGVVLGFGFLQQSDAAVTRIDASWGTQANYTTNSANYTPPAGTNRLVVISITAESNTGTTIGISQVTLGGQALTQIAQETSGTGGGYHNLLWLGYLKETGIAAMSGNAINITWTTAPNDPFGEPKVSWATFQSVDQTTPIASFNSANNGGGSTNNISSGNVAVGAGDLLIYNAVNGQPFTHTAPGGYTERVEMVGPGNDHTHAVAERDTTTASTQNPTASWSGSSRLAIIAAALNESVAGTLQFTSATYSENENVGTTTTITVSRTGGSTGAVSVDCVTSDGTATTADLDYTGGTYTLNWADGDSANKTCNIPINNDTKDENDETVNLTLQNATGGATIGAQSTAVLTILDDDPAPTVQFQAASSSGSEATTPAVINVTLSAASGKTVTVNYATANGTATAGSDYTAASGTLTFNPGVTSQSINVTIINDAVFEPDETFTVTLSAPSNATLGGTTIHTYTINNDDASPAGTLQFTSATYSENENVGTTTTITVSRTGGSTGAVSVDCVTSDGTATTADLDYTGGTYTLNWANGDSASKTCNIPINNDTKDEDDENVNLTLTNVAGGATIGAQNTAVLTIVDNDPLPTVQFQAATSSGSEATTPAVINVALSTASGKTVTVNYATADGTATAGSDYTAASGTLTFNPGVTSQSINVTIAEDVAVEANETFTITLSGPSNATLGGTTTHTYTINDNDAITPPTVSLINPKPGTATTPTVISLRPTTNDFKVQVKVWANAAISANTVQVGYYTGATPEAGPFTWVTASLNTNYPNSANYGVYEAWLSPPIGNYYLMARASEDGGVTYGYSRDNRTGNDARYIYVSVKAANTGTGMILARDSSSQLCLDCHNLATHSSETTDASYGNWQIGCLECHTPHSTKNIYLINGTITTPNSGNKTVIFYDTPGDAANSYVDSSAGGSTTGICQVCHTQTKDSSTSNARWRNSGNSDPAHYQTGGLNGTQRCTSCHPHTVGFKGSCTICHGYPPLDDSTLINATNIFGLTGRAAQFPGSGAGAHNIHYNTKGYGCDSCHNGGGPSGGHNKITSPALVHIGYNLFGGAYASGNYQAPDFSGPDYDLAAGAGTAITIAGVQRVCSNFYCHSKGQSSSSFTGANAPYLTSIWEGTLNNSCSGCHGNDSSAANIVSTGSHTKHVVASGYGCTNCHIATVSANRTISNQSNHVNNLVNVAFTSSVHVNGTYAGTVSPMTKAPGSSFGSCTNITCHNDGRSVWTGGSGVGNTNQWGTTGACNNCHGNTTYPSDYRMAGPLYDSSTGVSPGKPNAHRPHITAGTVSSGETQCLHCHYLTTTTNTTVTGSPPHINAAYTVSGGTYANGNDVSANTAVSTGWTYSGQPSVSTCAGVSCHPDGVIDTTFNTNTSLTIPWADKDSSNYQCTDCHKIDLVNTATYQHSMNTVTYTPNPASESDYLTSIPEGSATAGTNPSSRKCLMCHVKHNIFSDRMNSSIVPADARAANLRSNYSQIPTKTLYYGSKDYFNAAVPGVCLGCHQAERTKDTTRQKSETNSTKTPAISVANYDVSAHKYEVTTTTKTGTKTLYANCAKCHNAKNGETATFQNATIALRPRQFGVHASTARRLLAGLGGTLIENYEENFCYRCHSKLADAIGGTKKSVDANDWYGATGISMPAAATNIFAAFYDNPTTTPTAKTYSHKVASYSGLHKPSPTDETQAYMTANRHVECTDCHNVHAATSTNALKSVWGIDPTNSTTAGAAPTSYAVTTVTDPDHQYKICFKCHSDWAGYGTGTNQAVEFNPNNESFHWVEKDKYTYTTNSGTGKGIYNTAEFNLNSTGGKTYAEWMMPRGDLGWTSASYIDANLRTLSLRCSDCHGPSAITSTIPKGPHGSAMAKILKYPSGSSYTTWSSTATRTNAWCLNCHEPLVHSTENTRYGTGMYRGGKNLHGLHGGKAGGDGGRCQDCHLANPHGQTGSGTTNQRKHLLNPSVFRDAVDSETSGNWNQHGSWVISNCT